MSHENHWGNKSAWRDGPSWAPSWAASTCPQGVLHMCISPELTTLTSFQPAHPLDTLQLVKAPLKVVLGCACVQVCAQLCSTLCDPMDCSPASLLCPWDFPGKNTGMGCCALFQGIFPTQGLNTCLLHCRQILYHYATWEAHTDR